MIRTLKKLLTVLLLTVWASAPAMAQPTADAGPSQSVASGEAVTLDGSASIGGGTLNYQWTQTVGPAVLLDNNQTARPSFAAPSVAVNTDLNFELVVTEQSTGSSSTPDSVTITVRSVDSPVAKAGPDKHTRANAPVLLDGSGSFDPDGNIVNYQWTRLPLIQTADILGNGPDPACEVNALGRAEEVIELTVTDNQGKTATDTMSIFYQPPGVCGNGTVESDELCDSNAQPCFTVDNHPGNMLCNDQCAGFGACVSNESCGDGVINGNEVCDANTQACTASGGYAGIMSCNDQCTGFDTCVSTESCGDAIVNGSEVCDANTQACTASGGYAGTMSCNGQCTGLGSCTTNLSCGDNICSAPPETAMNCSQDCNPSFSVTLEAENMATKTTGGPTTGGWGIWNNGYVEDTVQFPATGVYRFDIIARGKVANNVWPNMQLRIDQSAKANFTVNTTGWATYTAQISVTQGSRKVVVAFTNDYYSSTADRNLYVDKVTIANESVGATQTIVETFSTPIIAQNAAVFGPGGQFTFSLDQNGTFLIDGTSGLAWQKSDSYRDSAFIRSTNPLPQTYKISVVAGDIDYGLEKLAGLQNDSNYPEGPLNENGCYLLAITEELPNAPHTNIWWHQHRKVVIDVDNNIWGHGMPNPVFMVYFDRDNDLVSYDGDQNTWQSQWTDAIHYQANTFYKIEIEKTLQEFIFRAFSENNQLLKEARVNLSEIWHEDGLHQEYFVVGDPHENYYQGSMKIKEISLQY